MLQFNQIVEILHQKTQSSDALISYYAYDSRIHLQEPEATLFIAFVSNSNDGHKYISEMISKGVRHFLIMDSAYIQEGASFIVVPDVLSALQTLAAHNRRLHSAKVIAITGSNGKTIVKDALALLCESAGFTTVKSPRSFNSQLGVALSLLQIKEDTEIAIIEAGISVPGEMKKLEEMIQPDIGICTHLGDAHGASFDSIEQKIEEKLNLFKGLDKVYINANNKYVSIVSKYVNVKKIQSKIAQDGLAIDGTRFILTQNDEVSQNNIGLAIAVGLDLGIKNIQEGLRYWVKPLNRLSVIDGVYDSIIINDSYTNDYEAFNAAINFTINNGGNRERVAIISAMENEVNADTVITTLRDKGFTKIYTIGFTNADFLSVEELLSQLEKNVFSNKVVLIKGLRRLKLERVSHWLAAKKNATRLEIKLDHLQNNYQLLKQHLAENVKNLVMLKAHAYGSGAQQIARFLKAINPDYIGVAHIDEAVELRNLGVSQPILVLYTTIDDVELMREYDLEPIIYSLSYLEQIVEIKNGSLNIHIEFDTGMHRLGFRADESDMIIDLLAGAKHKVVGIMSHLSSADERSKDKFTEHQITQFEMTAKQLEKGLGYTAIKHLCNSIATQRFKRAHFDMVRLGIGMYGFVSDSAKSIMQFMTQITQVKKIKAGQGVGYGNLDISEHPREIAIIPVGYADGFDRGLGNGNWKVIVNKVPCPTVGNICMDMTMIDVTAVNCRVNDEVILFGENLKVEEMAKVLNTIPYEIVSRISERVKRVYLSE